MNTDQAIEILKLYSQKVKWWNEASALDVMNSFEFSVYMKALQTISPDLHVSVRPGSEPRIKSVA